MKKYASISVFLVMALALLFVGRVRTTAASAMPIPAPPQQTIYCASDNMRRVYCPANVGNGVQLVRRRSDAPCTFGQTWGYDRRGIWVDRGCRADFVISGSWGGWDQGYNIYCASDNMRRNYCPTDVRGGVQLVRKRSDAPCVYGSTWGYDKRGVWVDRGCRADFQIGGGGSGWQPGYGGVQTVTCASNDMRRNYCAVPTSGGVRLVRQRSDADCVYGRTWGYDGRGIWVDRGCRADFEVGRYR